ncbi:MAG: adenosylmethionine decarboxylase [Pirellula sp.]
MNPSVPLGWHWLVDMQECAQLPTDPQSLEAILLEAARLARATVVQSCFHRFSPHGLSGVVVIAESHLAAHTWPEHRAMCLDLFSCSESILAGPAIDYIGEQVAAGKINRRCELRGIATTPRVE